MLTAILQPLFTTEGQPYDRHRRRADDVRPCTDGSYDRCNLCARDLRDHYRVQDFRKKVQKGAAATLSRMIQRFGGVQLRTVQTIVMSVLVLSIVGVLEGALTVSVLSGIAGYVLGTGGQNDRTGTAGQDKQPGDI
jgi:hypothetical protein